MGVFQFTRFAVDDHGCGMKICSDSVLLAAWFLSPYSDRLSVADVGSGSGVLALLAADIMPQARIAGVELDSSAAAAASANFCASPWKSRLSIVNADFLAYAAEGHTFDIVISNPPYFTDGLRSADSARADARHQSGLTYASLLKHNMLAPDGRLGMVSPAEFEQEIIYQAELAGLKLRRICRVVTASGKAPTRLLWDFALADGPISDETLCLRNPDGTYSAEYRRLVSPFYIRL